MTPEYAHGWIRRMESVLTPGRYTYWCGGGHKSWSTDIRYAYIYKNKPDAGSPSIEVLEVHATYELVK